MRSNDPFRALWKRVARPAPATDMVLDRLASRIAAEASAELRACAGQAVARPPARELKLSPAPPPTDRILTPPRRA